MFEGMGADEIDPDSWEDLNDPNTIQNLNAQNQDVAMNTQVPLNNGMSGMGQTEPGPSAGWAVGAEEGIPPGTGSQPKAGWGDVIGAAVGGASKFVQGGARVDQAQAQATINQLKAEQAATNQNYQQRILATQQATGYKSSWVSRFGTAGVLAVVVIAGGIYYFTKKRRRRR